MFASRFKASSLLLIITAAVFLTSCTSTVPLNVPETPPPVPELDRPPEVALVLSGGGARGYAHVGAIEALEEKGIPTDLIVGSSAGSLVGALYSDTADSSQLRDTMLNSGFLTFADIAPIYQLGGIMNGNRLQKFLLKNMQSQDFQDLNIKFISIATDLMTGEAVSIESGPVAPAVTASAALPGVLQPVQLYGRYLIDGGVVEPIPVRFAKRYNPKVIIAIDVSQPLSDSKPKTAYGVYSRAYDILWKRLEEETSKGADIIIRPEVGDIGRFSTSAKGRLMQLGHQAVENQLPEILDILETNNIKLKDTSS